MEQILIPTDFSGTAGNATQYALEFFSGEDCTFHFLNTYTPDFVNSRVLAVGYGNGAEDQMQQASEEGLRTLVEELESEYPEYSYETTSSFNLLTEEIRERANFNGIGLIVSGTTGASGLREIFLGSNTVRILRSSEHCPVLVVPKEASFSPPKKIGFISDFSRPYSTLQLEKLQFFASRFDSRLEIIHIGNQEGLNSLQQYHLRQLLLELGRLAPVLRWIPPEAGKAELIRRYCDEEELDMLVMVRHEHSPMEELLREPVVKRLAFHLPIPMLVLPEPAV